MTAPPITPQPGTQGTYGQQPRQAAAPLAGYIIGIAIALFLALPVVALGAALALNIMCWIAGVCV